MTRYRYKALGQGGRPRAGWVEAASAERAEAILAARGLTGVDVTPDLARRRPLSTSEVTELLDRLVALTRAGVPLPGGLRAAVAEVESAPLRDTLSGLAAALDRGGAVDAALVEAAGDFPAHLQALTRAGARTGRLADVLGEVVQASNLGADLRRKLRATLAYPAVLLAMVAGLTVFVANIAHRSGLRAVFEDFGVAMPAIIPVTMAINRFIADTAGGIALGGLAVAGIGFVLWRRALTPRQRGDWLATIPLYGAMIRFVGLAEFCHLIALLVEAGLPLPEAIDLAGGSIRDPALASTCGEVAAGVAEGQTLAQSLRRWPGLPASLGQLLAWGEDHGELAGALRFAGDMFEARAEAQAGFTGRVARSGLLVLVLWWIGFAVASLYLPLVSVVQLLSKLAG